MHILGDGSIKRKLTLIIMLTSSVALLLASTAYVTYELIMFRRAMVHYLSTLAEITGDNSTGALTFDNQDDAEKLLAALRAEQHIVAVCIYGTDSQVFAKYLRDDVSGDFPLPEPREDSHRFKDGYLVLFRRIVLDNETIGTIYLQSDMQELYSRLKRYASISAIIMLVSSLMAFLLTSKLQREISEPILHLVQTAKVISDQKDYSVRAVKHSHDELGTLIEAFNEMLAQIQARDAVLMAAEERTRLIVETALDAIIILDSDGLITDWNPQAGTIFGWSRQEVVGRNLFSTIIPPQYREAHKGGLKHFLGIGEELVLNKRIEITALHRDGHEFPAELTITLAQLGDKFIFSIFSRDITALKQAEEELRVTNTILLTQQETTIEGILVVDDKKKWISFNQQFVDMWAIPPNIVAARSSEYALRSVMDKLVHPQQFCARVKYLYEHRHEKSYEEIALVDGRTFERYSAPMWSGERYYGRVWYYRDITEHKKIDQMKNEFISVVSHELRTPLTSILGSLGLIAGGVAGELPTQAKTMIDIAMRNSERLVNLINDILDIEKIESGKMEFKLKPIELMPLVEQAIEANRPYGERLGVTFMLGNTLPGVRSNVDSDRLMQVFANLLSNAAKFSPPHGEVVISVSRHHNGIRVAVTDQGPGIPEEFRSRIFQKFAQADTSTTREISGTGLGLSICKAIVKKLGGEIDFETEINGGTTFYFDLPEWHEEQVTVVEHTAPSCISEQVRSVASTRDSEALQAQPRILICEDDRDVATLLNVMLNRAGFNTDIAYNAASAKQLLTQNPYAAMTLDIVLPDQDGISLIHELRGDDAHRHLPIIVVSVKADRARQELINGSAMAIIDWINKPIDPERLITAVKGACRWLKSGMPCILHVEDDPDVFQVVSTILKDTAAVVSATNLQEAKQKLKGETFDLILLDLVLPDGNGLDLLPILHSRTPPIPVVVFSAQRVAMETARKVAAALVKSRTSNAELLETIQSLIKRNT